MNLPINQGRVESGIRFQSASGRHKHHVVEGRHHFERLAPFIPPGVAVGAHIRHVDLGAFRHLRRSGPMSAQTLRGNPPDPFEDDYVVLRFTR